MSENNLNILYSNMLTKLPEANIAFKGLKGWVSQGENHQIVFFDIEAIGEVAEHKHGAQWGLVLEGEMELTIGGVTNTYKNGESYYVPENVLHSAVFIKRTKLIDFFVDKDRYKLKDQDENI